MEHPETIQVREVYMRTPWWQRIMIALLSMTGLIAMCFMVVIGGFILLEGPPTEYAAGDESEMYEDSRTMDFSPSCNVAGFALYGSIDTYADKDPETNESYTSANKLESFMLRVGNADQIKAILVEVDSLGGNPVAGDEMATYLAASAIPVVVRVRSAAASAGYLAIVPARHIIAHRYADIGGIGVTMSYLSYGESNEQSGIRYERLVSAPFKDYGTEDRTLTDTERALMQRDIDLIHEGFVDSVAKYRELPRETVARLADGATLPAPLALEAGLIDELGGEAEVRSYLASILKEEPIICW
jgi:signal peptide peptidase SppA